MAIIEQNQNKTEVKISAGNLAEEKNLTVLKLFMDLIIISAILLTVHFMSKVTSTKRAAVCHFANSSFVGSVYFEEIDNGLRLFGNLTSSSANNTQRGFHIHIFGNLQSKCSKTGSHFNPTNSEHGAPQAVKKHAGDLGNLKFEDGFVAVNVHNHFISFDGKTSIIGRSLVIHEQKDDLGKGKTKESKETGSSGAKAACCSIVATSPEHNPL